MKEVLPPILALIPTLFRSRSSLQLEILDLRHHADFGIMPTSRVAVREVVRELCWLSA